jgi:hypothetical protein
MPSSYPPLTAGGHLPRLSLAVMTATLVLAFTPSLLPSWSAASAQERRPGNISVWERSIVTIEVARKQYDYAQPWSKRTKRLEKVGTVVGEKQILTTADEVFDRTLVRLQKGGRGRWWIGEVAWVDYHANLAIITAGEEEFWRDLTPVTFGTDMPADGTLQVLRWRDGVLQSRRAEFTHFSVREGQLSPINQVALEASSEIQGAGRGEPVIANAHVVGIMWDQDGRNCTAAPTSFIRPILEARAKGEYRGLGYFHFFWQPGVNPATLAMLKQTGEPRGVIVCEVPDRPDNTGQVIQPKDILLSVAGFDVGIEGDYLDPEFGIINLEILATRGRWAGEEVKVRLWRDGKEMEVAYRLPKFEYTNALVPHATYDREPEYLVVGGLVFQPLTDSFLQSWGAEWKRRAPFRLRYYGSQPPTKDRPALVVLSEILPDPYNIGYQEQKYLALDKVNGTRVNYLGDLQEALRKPQDGLHVLEFVQSDSLRRMIISAGEAEKQATARVLKRYGIARESHIEAAKE